MAIKPIVRYMLLCDDYRVDPENNRRVTIIGLISNIRGIDDPAYPLLYREMCVFLALTEVREAGKGKIVCALDETGQRIFETLGRPISSSSNPLEVVGVPFRIRNCLFPEAGLYTVQFWYEGELIEERPLRMR